MATRANFPGRKLKRKQEAEERQKKFDVLSEAEKQKRRPRDAEGRKLNGKTEARAEAR